MQILPAAARILKQSGVDKERNPHHKLLEGGRGGGRWVQGFARPMVKSMERESRGTTRAILDLNPSCTHRPLTV